MALTPWLVAFFFEILAGEIKRLGEGCARFDVLVGPEQVGGAQQHGNALQLIVKRSGQVDLLTDGCKSIFATAKRGKITRRPLLPQVGAR